MNYADSIKRAGRSLKNAKARTILTALAIAVGSFTLTMSIAAGTGARQYADKIISSNVDPQSLFVAKDPALFGESGGMTSGLREYSADSTAYGGATFKALTADDITKIRENSMVEKITPSYLVQAQYFAVEGQSKKFVTDVTVYDPSVRSETASGSLPSVGTQIADDSVVIPEAFLGSFDGKPAAKDMIGKTITLRLARTTNQPNDEQLQQILSTEGTAGLEKAFTPETKDVSLKIVAVSAKSSTSFSASNGLFISEQKAKELSDYVSMGTPQYQKYISAVAIVKDGQKPETAKSELEKNGVIVKTAKDLQGFLFSIVNILQGIVAGFGVLALIASIFGIINTQYISVLERTREIGLMKALGMRGRHVRRLFQVEAAWIGFLGGVIGALIAWGVGTAINPWLSSLMSIGENRILVFELLPIALLIVALMLVAMLAGWFPARKASKLDPIEALRTE